MKKRELKAKIAELETQADMLRRSSVLERERAEQWRKTAGETHTELVKWMALARNESVVIPRSANITSGRALADLAESDSMTPVQRIRLLAANLGISEDEAWKYVKAHNWCPPMTVTATNEQDAPLAAAATQAVNFALRDKPASRADKEDLYRDGLACGLSSEAAWERAKMGVEAWNAKERKPQ